MQPYSIWHRVLVGVTIVTLLIVTYTTILINNFKTPEKTSDFLRNSNAYYNISEIIKANIRNRYSKELKTNVIKLSAADTILNYVVTPNVVERIAQPALQLRQKIAKLPLSFVEKNVVINTSDYTKQFSSTLNSLNLPPTIQDAGNNLIAAIPPQITVVDTTKNPNSVLVTITKTKTFFMNILKILDISAVILIIAIAALIIINLGFFKRLIFGLFLVFLICGAFGILMSYIVPSIATSLSSSPDPVAGVLKDNLWDDIVWYYFQLTRQISLIYLLASLGLYLLYRYVPFVTVQRWLNEKLYGEEGSPSREVTQSQAVSKPRKGRPRKR